MPNITVKVPPSKTEQTITIPWSQPAVIIGDPVVTGGTPIDVVTPPPVDPPVSGYKQTADTDFNESSDVNDNQLGLGGFASFDGRTVFKSVTNSSSNQSSGYRSEQQYTGSAYNPSEGAWEYECYYPAGSATNSGGDYDSHVVQWHPTAPEGASATLSLNALGGVYKVVRNIDGSNIHQSTGVGRVVYDKWIKHRWEIKWAKDRTGYVRLYLDGVLYFEVKNVQTIRNSSQQPYFKLGVNRFANLNKTVTLYYDNLKVYAKV